MSLGEKLNLQPTGCAHPSLCPNSPPPDPKFTDSKGISALEFITGERGVNRNSYIRLRNNNSNDNQKYVAKLMPVELLSSTCIFAFFCLFLPPWAKSVTAEQILCTLVTVAS